MTMTIDDDDGDGKEKKPDEKKFVTDKKKLILVLVLSKIKFIHCVFSKKINACRRCLLTLNNFKGLGDG